MADVSTVKIEELIRKIPVDCGLDPRLIEEAKTELNVLKFRAGASLQTHKQKSWSKSDIDKLHDDIRDRDTEIVLLKRQLHDRSKFSRDKEQDAQRAAKIKEDYTKLYQHHWTDSFDFFKLQGWHEIEIILFLQRILRACYSFCKDVAQEQLQNIEGEALYPTATWMDDDGIITRLQQRQINREIAQLAKLYQRTTAQECLPALQKTFIEHVLPTFIDKSTSSYNQLKRYTKKCIDITWSMCIQDPPLVFVDRLERGADFDTERFRKYTENGGNKFDYLVWPVMLLHKGGFMMCKGVAQAIKSSGRETSPTRTPVSRDTRSRPDDVNDFESDRNSWKKVDSRSNTLLSTEGPPKVYKWAPNREGTVPRSPYFDPYTSKSPRTVEKPAPRDSRHQSRHESPDDRRFSGPLKETKNENLDEGKLTVVWKNKKSDRAPSAP